MTIDDWKREGNPWRVVEASAKCENAKQAALERIIDTLLELQLERRHEGVGHQPFSVTGNIPMPGSGKAVDQCMMAAERYRPDSEWHRACKWMMSRLPKRQAAAMMLQAARVRPAKMEDIPRDKDGHPFQVTANGLVRKQRELLKSLGMGEYIREPFDSVEAMQKAARRARNRLREWLAQGEISAAA
jgi:hypothetical protein